MFIKRILVQSEKHYYLINSRVFMPSNNFYKMNSLLEVNLGDTNPGHSAAKKLF